jgi:hypothetical protein
MCNKKIVIISAARSGTKMLRFVLSASDLIASYPYDANYIWKYGNYSVGHDEIDPDSISEIRKEKIRSFFLNICKKEAKPIFLEKSVPNSLRVPFVRSVFPDSKIIHLYRSGMDVAADSRLCWQDSATSERIQSKEDRRRKLKEFPFTMAWPYLFEYAVSYGKKYLLNQDHVSSWGPRYRGIDDDIRNKSLLEVCAIQWKKCVDHCCDELTGMKKGKDYINISYEKLAHDPKKYLQKIVEFVEIDDGKKVVERGVEKISTSYIDSWKNYISEDEQESILKIISAAQQRINQLD